MSDTVVGDTVVGDTSVMDTVVGDTVVGNTVVCDTVVGNRRPSMMESMKEFYTEKSNDQDFNQKVNVALTLLLEMYRVIMGSLLILMVPQGCGDHICDINDNIERTGTLDYVGLATNFATLASMLVLYYIEVKRENKMINYLEVNPAKPRDNKSVGEALELLAEDKKNKILSYDNYYCNAGYFSIGLFTLNAIFSSLCIFQHYLDSKTTTVLLTNILFMGSKLADVITTVKTDKNIFYSAYLKRKVQYNDVDPDKLLVEGLPDAENAIETDPMVENDTMVYRDIVVEIIDNSKPVSNQNSTDKNMMPIY